MPLSKRELDRILQLIGQTNDRELNCEECLSLVAEFAEQQLAGKPVSTVLRAIEQHLLICDECREEYEALRQAIVAMDDGTDD